MFFVLHNTPPTPIIIINPPHLVWNVKEWSQKLTYNRYRFPHFVPGIFFIFKSLTSLTHILPIDKID
jgi:hypothetical protein